MQRTATILAILCLATPAALTRAGHTAGLPVRRPVALRAGLPPSTSPPRAPPAGGTPPPLTREQRAARDYVPRPKAYKKIARDYLRPRLVGPYSALVEYKAGPKP